jgi:exopolyphosphatase/guanosine-5'-triphosphate,3'-diphosphate pyrophosphatase
VGSNTIRLLVARLEDGNIETLLDESEFVRLGAGVDAGGALRPEREETAIKAIGRMSSDARERGAEGVVAIATSAVRDARNGREFVRRVRERTGVEIDVISGEREAYLTYRGATLGLSLADGVIVCDLGGGSAELIYADFSGVRWSVSVPLGSGRLTERFVGHDPPAAEEVDALQTYVTSVLAQRTAPEIANMVLTGGTATHLGWLAGTEGVIQELTVGDVGRVMGEVGSHPASSIVEKYGVKLERAQVLPAGIAAIQALVRFYTPERIVVTQRGIREGALLDALEGNRDATMEP